MAIAQKPKRDQSGIKQVSSERAAESFIAGGAGKIAEKGRAEKTAMTLRIDSDLLVKIDRAAKARGISRTAWLLYTVSGALTHGEG